MRKLFILLFLILLPNIYAADFYSFNSSFNPPKTRFIYLIPVPNMTNDILLLGTNCLNITGGRLAGSRCLTPAIITINFICENNGDCFLPDTCLPSLVCGLDTSEIEVGEIPATLQQTMAIILPVAISTFFIAVGVAQAIPIVGVMGATMLLTESWYIASFEPLIALTVALLSLILLVFFIFWRRRS